MYLVINKWVIAVKLSNFSGQYLRNCWTLDIGVLCYIGIVWPKEHPPEVWSIPLVTPCIWIVIHSDWLSINHLYFASSVETSALNWCDNKSGMFSDLMQRESWIQPRELCPLWMRHRKLKWKQKRQLIKLTMIYQRQKRIWLRWV